MNEENEMVKDIMYRLKHEASIRVIRDNLNLIVFDFTKDVSLVSSARALICYQAHLQEKNSTDNFDYVFGYFNSLKIYLAMSERYKKYQSKKRQSMAELFQLLNKQNRLILQTYSGLAEFHQKFLREIKGD